MNSGTVLIIYRSSTLHGLIAADEVYVFTFLQVQITGEAACTALLADANLYRSVCYVLRKDVDRNIQHEIRE